MLTCLEGCSVYIGLILEGGWKGGRREGWRNSHRHHSDYSATLTLQCQHVFDAVSD